MRVCIFAMALAMTTPAAASPGVLKDWGLTPQSGDAVVIMRVPTFSNFSYSLSFSRDGSTGFLSRVFVIDVRQSGDDYYVGRTLRPGRYVMTSISQQTAWKSCFAEAAPLIEVEAGHVYYMGTLNAREMLTDLQQDAVARGKTTLSSITSTIGWRPTVAPKWTISGTPELDAAKRFVAQMMPQTTAPVLELKAGARAMSVSAGAKAMQICG